MTKQEQEFWRLAALTEGHDTFCDCPDCKRKTDVGNPFKEVDYAEAWREGYEAGKSGEQAAIEFARERILESEFRRF